MPKAKQDDVKPDFVDDDAVESTQIEVDHSMATTAPDDWEWENVAEESPTKVVLEAPGDKFVGQFVKRVTIAPPNDEPFDLWTYRGRNGVLYALNTGYKLDAAMEDVEAGKWVMVTLIKLIPVKKGNPLKDVRVDVRK